MTETSVQTTDNTVGAKGSKPRHIGLISISHCFALALIFKITLMVLFSSGYMDQLFVPFISHYLSHFDNAWDYFYQTSNRHDQFPYQPLMLYILSFACLPLKSLGWSSPFLVNFFMKVPNLLADILITALLIKMFPNRVNKVFWYYFLSPIILYACYMHSQLDLIPTALLFASAYYLRRDDTLKAAVLAGLALSTKTHVAAALPLFAIYLSKNRKPVEILRFTFFLILPVVILLYPYLDSPGFQALVIHNPRQKQIFESSISIGSMQIFLPVLAVLISYCRFALYPKINRDLFDAFITIVFASFVLLIVPAPGWYVWIAPYLSLFAIKYSSREKRIQAAALLLSAVYVVYFLFFHQFDYTSLTFCNHAISLQIADSHLASVAFTFLEAALLVNIVLCYRIGVRSNFNYKRDKALVIGIGGDSGAGKSTLLKDLKALLRDNMVELEGDADHKWERGDENWNSRTHLDPKANYLHKQAEAIFNLKRGRSVERADYDHSIGAFTTARKIDPKDFIVISGLHTFYLPKSRKAIDLKIFMDPEDGLKSRWKIERDTSERGYSPPNAEKQLNRRKSDADKFIAPQREFADISVRYFELPLENAEQKPGDTPRLGISLSLSSSVQLDHLVQRLINIGMPLEWDYSQNLSKQELTLLEPLPENMLQSLAQEMIPNLDDLIDTQIRWESGFRGFVQLIILLALNDLMKEKEDGEN